MGARLTERNSWTKILTKSTERNRSVISRMRAVDIPALAGRYSSMRESIVNAKMAELRTVQHAAFPDVATVPSQGLSAAFDTVEQDLWAGLTMEPNFEYAPFDWSEFGL